MIKMGKICFYNGLVLMCLLYSFTTSAQSTLTLSQAIRNGLANKKNILAGKLDITISQLQTKSLYQKYLPQVSVEYQYLYNPILQTSILPIGVFNPNYPIDANKSVQFGTKWTQTAGITATYPLLDLSIRRHISEAKLQERIVGLSQEQSEYELAYTIAQTYIDVFLDEAKIKSFIADTNRTYISYSLLKDKYDEKRLLKSDLNKSKINHNNTVQLLSNGIAQLIQDKVYLMFLMGTNDIEKWGFTIDTTFSIAYTFEDMDGTINIGQLPEMQLLSLQSERTILQEKSEQAKHIPTVGLKGYLGANQYSNTFDPTAANTWFGQSYVGLNIKIPILFGESTHNNIQQLKIQSDQLRAKAEDKEKQYEQEAMTAKINLENIQTQLKTQEENILLSTESIDIFQARFKEGQESASNLNLEEANLQATKVNYELIKKQRLIYRLDYLKATGQLTILWK
ncbi:MAG TPA: TolC family protein [Saprospiraceae bacterium]|nr:TolC family protein [Saprospiraceae bacterium]